MEIRISQTPKYPGIHPTNCAKCGAEILILRSAKNSNATIVLDERTGPYKIEGPHEDGNYKAVWRGAGDYAFHFDGGCNVDVPEQREPSQFDAIRDKLEGKTEPGGFPF
jgi:hypothetical protein